jgi:hypothetical protein
MRDARLTEETEGGNNATVSNGAKHSRQFEVASMVSEGTASLKTQQK